MKTICQDCHPVFTVDIAGEFTPKHVELCPLHASTSELLAELKALDNAIMAYGIHKDGSDAKWLAAFTALIERLQSTRKLIEKAEAQL